MNFLMNCAHQIRFCLRLLSKYSHYTAQYCNSSCESERSISLLKLLKSRLRQTMTEEHLNALALMQCHKDIPIKTEDVLNAFAAIHPRRLELL